MATGKKRGPKKGKRVTLDVQAQIVLKALHSTATLQEVIDEFKKSGYNFNEGVETNLMAIKPIEIAFMVANQEVLEKVQKEAIQEFITEIKNQ